MSNFLLLCFLLFTSHSVNAQSEAEIFSKVFKTKTKWVPTSFIFQNKDIGEVPVKFEGNQAISILKAKKIFGSFLLDESTLRDSEMSFDELSKIGIQLSLNEEKFYIETYITPSSLKEKTTNFTNDYRPRWVNKITRPSDLSFYSNIYYYRPYSHNIRRDNSDEIDIQPNLNYKGFVIESSHTHKESKLHRKSTRALYDFEHLSSRLSVGDSTTPSTDYLSGVSILGASYGKDFSLRPYDTTVPRGKAEFDLLEASTVRVFVNGTLINVIKLQAGAHKLEDLPLIQGLNEIKLVIESDVGRVDEIIIPAAFSQDLLKVGLSDYYYGVGKRSELIDLDRKYQDDELIYTGYYRRGLTDRITVGGFFQADDRVQLLGSDQVFSTSYGQVKTQVAALNSTSKGGFSVKGEYFFLDQRIVGVAASGHLFGFEHRSDGFHLIDQTSGLGFSQNILNYAFNKNIYGYSYRIGGQFESNGDRKDTWALTGSLGKTFKRRLNINTVSTYRTLVNGDNSFEVSLYFSWFLPEKGHNIYGSYNSLSKASQVSMQKIKTSSNDKFTYQVTGRNADVENSLEVDSRYDHDRFEVGLRHSQQKIKGSSDKWNSYEGNVKFGTAVAMLDGKFSFGKPITNSFAILTRDKNLQGEKLLINSNGDQIAEGGFFDNILISKVQPYRYFQISSDSAFLSDGLSIEEGDFALLPTYKSGSLISLKSKGAMSIFGSVTFPDSSRASLETFEILNSQGSVVYASFTNRKGRILVEGIEGGNYSLSLNLGNDLYSANFILPKGKIGFVDIGNLMLKKVKR